MIEPTQMTREEMISRLDSGSDPITVAIEKYQMYKEWCKYQLENDCYIDIEFESNIYAETCALCHIHENDCTKCELTAIKQECCPDKGVITPWRRVKYAAMFIDESEDRQVMLFEAIDNMIKVLEECRKIE